MGKESQKGARPKARAIQPEASSDFIGLKNQGKTCHLNTVLQALFMTDEFRVSLQECAAAGKLAPLPDALCALFDKLQTSSRAISTKPLSATLKRLGLSELNEQQDAHDIWLRLNDRLENELKTSRRPKLVNELFEGKQKQYVTCGTCGNTSETLENFSCLELNVPDNEAGEDSPDVLSALRARLKEEQLCGDEQYVCDKCNCKRDAVRGVRLSSLPPILSFHLARFRYRLVAAKAGCMGCWGSERDGDHRLVKLTSPLRFSKTIVMDEFISRPDGSRPSEPDSAAPSSHAAPGAEGPAAASTAEDQALVYELYAVVMHVGSPSDGHYYALIQDAKSQTWFVFNDERVVPMPESELQNACGSSNTADARRACAYMLLYRRKSPLEGGSALLS